MTASAANGSGRSATTRPRRRARAARTPSIRCTPPRASTRAYRGRAHSLQRRRSRTRSATSSTATHDHRRATATARQRPSEARRRRRPAVSAALSSRAVVEQAASPATRDFDGTSYHSGRGRDAIRDARRRMRSTDPSSVTRSRARSFNSRPRTYPSRRVRGATCRAIEAPDSGGESADQVSRETNCVEPRRAGRTSSASSFTTGRRR